MFFPILTLLIDEPSNVTDRIRSHLRDAQSDQHCYQMLSMRRFIQYSVQYNYWKPDGKHHKAMVDNLEGLHGEACTWPGVECDKHGFIKAIQWSAEQALKPQGPKWMLELDYCWIPSTVEYINSERRPSTEFLRTEFLPRDLHHAHLAECRFYGPLNLQSLPYQMETLDVRLNHFSGTVNVRDLPYQMTRLLMKDNNFSSVQYGADTPKNVYVDIAENSPTQKESSSSKRTVRAN